MKKVLIVDDEESFRKTIVASLVSKGYQAIEAEDGMAGLDTATEQRPDLIISDVNMDNMNGFMMVEMLQQNPKTAKIPVIMMTGAAQAAGAWNSTAEVIYLEKGFAMPELIAAVDSLLKK
jgi:CheY-like chemotaxis protein